jgi:hypothetical protein
LVALDGVASTDSDGSIVSYSWRENGVEIASGAQASVALTVGIHDIALLVTDDDGATGEDHLSITVNPAPTPTPGNEGCGVGYWKNNQHYDSWPAPYVPLTLFPNVFGRSVASAPTLIGGLSVNGGGVKALARQAVAALLNAASDEVAYPYSVEQVVSLFQSAYDSGQYEATKNQFEAANSLNCPLN